MLSNLPKKFKTNNSLMQHMKIHTEPKQFNCPECTKVSSSKTGLEFHIEANHIEKTHTCEKCSKTFKRQYCLQRHAQKCLMESKEKHFEATCYACGKTFGTKKALSDHTRTLWRQH